MMKRRVILICLGVLTMLWGENMDMKQIQKGVEALEKPLYNPFIERYLIDEVKNLRSDQYKLRVELREKVSQAHLDLSDRAMDYMTSTVNNIFFLLTAAVSLVALFGWRSLKDAREQTAALVQQRLDAITQEYEQKLAAIEHQMHQRSEDIMSNQEHIARSNEIHALWRRSNLEENIQAKVDIYDQILSLDRYNVEALTYKADAVLDLGEREWALNLCNQALELDSEYAYSYWQRACVNAELNNVESAIGDITKAIEFSPALAKDIATEKSFDLMKDAANFKHFLQEELPLLQRQNSEPLQ